MTGKSVGTALPQMLLDTCMCHKARMAARVVTRAYDDALRPTGLRATQISVLAAVGASSDTNVRAGGRRRSRRALDQVAGRYNAYGSLDANAKSSPLGGE